MESHGAAIGEKDAEIARQTAERAELIRQLADAGFESKKDSRASVVIPGGVESGEAIPFDPTFGFWFANELSQGV